MRDSVTQAPRVFFHTPGTKASLAKNAAHQFAQRHALVHYASGAIFSFVPKNACTSLRTSLALANGAIGDVVDWNWVHKNNDTFSADLRELITASSTTILLRCPHKRLASTFLDKIVSRSGQLRLLRRRSPGTIDPDQFTFRQFVDHLTRRRFLRLDIHWRPQVDFFAYRNYDHVFGMHEVAAFADHFERLTGQPFADSRSFSGHVTSSYDAVPGALHADTPLSDLTKLKAEGKLPTPPSLFDDALTAQVATLYARDLTLYRTLLGRDGLLFPDVSPETAP